MVETNTSCLFWQNSSSELSAFKNYMIAPVEHRQHEFLPASLNPFSASRNFGFNELGFSSLPERCHTIQATTGLTGKFEPHSQRQLLTPNQYLGEQTSLFPASIVEKPSTYETPGPQQKRFLIFDQSGNETRLIFSSLCPRVQNPSPVQAKHPAWNLQAAPAKYLGSNQIHTERQYNNAVQVCTKTPILHEVSGENEVVHEGSEMREDTEEINALLYSEDDTGDDGEEEDDDDDVLSTGHSPLAAWGDSEKHEEQEENDFDDEAASLSRSSKRQKALDGGGHKYNKLQVMDLKTSGVPNGSDEDAHTGDLVYDLDEGVSPDVGSKRPRKDKIHDTLRVLKSIIPRVKSKDPSVILDEAISYLKSLKHNAKTMAAEEQHGSSCYGPLY